MAESSIERFVESVTGKSHLRVEHDFGDGFVRLQTSEADRRQAAQDIRCSEDIVLELLRNSCDAHAAHIFIATGKQGSRRQLTVIDDGVGIPAVMHELVFEPRVTSKLDTSHRDKWGYHGRGMALYSIRVNAQDVRIASSEKGLGCSLQVVTDTANLPEKTDQSTFPTFSISEDGAVNVRGPKNILRTACEFALETRSQCSVFVGSQTEIAATLYAYGTSTLSVVDRAFTHDIHELPVVKRLATAADPDYLAEIAAELGLELSPRSARRVLDGQIEPARNVLERIVIDSGAEGKPQRVAKRKPLARAAVRLSAADASALAHAVKCAYGEIAERYYLEPDVDPRIAVRRGSIAITIPAVEKDR